MRKAVLFLLSHVERHGDSPTSAKATQHIALMAPEAHEPEADATGDPGKFEKALEGAAGVALSGLGALGDE